MKTAVEMWKKFLYRTTLCYTLVVTAFAFTGFAVRPDSNVMFCSQLLWMLVFALLVGITFFIADFVKNNAVIKYSVQFLLTYGSFALTFFAGGAGRTFMENESQNVAFTVISTSLMFIGIYVVIAAVVFGVRSAKSRFANRKQKYDPQFEDIKK